MTVLIEFLTSKRVTVLMLVVCFYLGIRSGYFKGVRGYFKNFSIKTYLLLASLIGFFFVLTLFFDQQILNAMQAMSHPVAIAADHLGGYLSKNTVFWMTLSSLYLLSFFAKQGPRSEVLYGSLLATAFTGLVSQIIKFTFVRARPYSDFGPFSFFNWAQIHEDTYQSLPSGDVALVAGASFLVFYSIRRFYWKGLILVLPFAAAFFRIVENKHWPSDTLASIGIGLIVGLFVWSYKKIQI